jgi:hypothetical protein
VKENCSLHERHKHIFRCRRRCGDCHRDMFLLVEQAGEPEGSAPNQYQMESSDDEAEEVETEQKALLTD